MNATRIPVKIDVVPEVLIWARESVGLPVDLAAKRLGVKPDTLVRMEQGHIPIAMPKLRQMAQVYDRPLIAFFLPEPPQEEERIADFRVISDSESRTWSTALFKAYRRVIGQRQIALELWSSDNGPMPVVDLHLRVGDDVDDAGISVRKWLEPPEFQSRDQYSILNTWLALIEDKGVLVVQVSGVSIEEMRGFSIGEHPLPVVALNGSEFPRGKLFTLVHELVHVLVHRGALCDLEDEARGGDSEGQRLEWFCNGVAAATLMPREEVVRLIPRSTARLRTEWSDDELMELSGQFGVSVEAMLVRLVTLGFASREFYRQRRPIFVERYREQRQISSGRLTYYPKQIRNLGRRYIDTVWRAYERGEISDPELSTYLQTKIQNVPKLIEKAGLDQ